MCSGCLPLYNTGESPVLINPSSISSASSTDTYPVILSACTPYSSFASEWERDSWPQGLGDCTGNCAGRWSWGAFLESCRRWGPRACNVVRSSCWEGIGVEHPSSGGRTCSGSSTRAPFSFASWLSRLVMDLITRKL